MKMRNLLICIGIIFLLLFGCSNNNTKQLFDYYGSYAGDNSAVGNITRSLFVNEHLTSIELQTQKKPYGIILNYDWNVSSEEYKETIVTNAAVLFTLIHNADWISFRFEDKQFTIHKQDLQNWSKKEFREIENKEELSTLIKELLNRSELNNQLPFSE